MTGLDFEKAITALACWRSLKNEQYRGMSFGAMALRNRAAESGKSIYEHAVHLLDAGEWPDAREPQFQSLLSVLDGIYSDTTPDRTDGATHWVSEGDVVGERTCGVGQVIFYKGEK
jgi:hypothetical protein